MAIENTANKNTITAILLGRTGAGKSLLGNKLLGLKETDYFFKVAEGSMRPRETIASNFTKRYLANEEVLLRVLDTPGFFDDEDTIADRWIDVLKAYDLADGSIDVIVIVINVNDFQNGINVMKILMKYFDRITRYAVVVFTNHEEAGYTESDVLAYFNENYPGATAGITFVLSDQMADESLQQDTIAEIYENMKRIKKRRPLMKKDLELFFADNLQAKIISKNIPSGDINMEGLQAYPDLRIDLVKRYVEEQVLNKVCEDAKKATTKPKKNICQIS